MSPTHIRHLAVDVPDCLVGIEGEIDVAVILGSGLSAVADALEDAREWAYGDIAHFPQAAAQVTGHAGRLVSGRLGGRGVAAFQGRLHMYQGFDALEAAYPARLAAALGARVLIVTNAAGGVSERVSAGDLMLITDHLDLTGDNPLIGWPGPEGGTPFVPLTHAYDEALAGSAREVASELGVGLKEGVYAAVRGPSFETPAEVAMLRTLGADAVGMSTVPEVIAARALDVRVMGVSLVSNVAAGETLSHDEVLETGARTAGTMAGLLVGILKRL